MVTNRTVGRQSHVTRVQPPDGLSTASQGFANIPLSFTDLSLAKALPKDFIDTFGSSREKPYTPNFMIFVIIYSSSLSVKRPSSLLELGTTGLPRRGRAFC